MRKNNPVYLCDWCEKPIPDPVSVNVHSDEPQAVNAVIITIGYSFGGFGARRNMINTSFPEVCKNCFTQYLIIAGQLARLTKTGSIT